MVSKKQGFKVENIDFEYLTFYMAYLFIAFSIQNIIAAIFAFITLIILLTAVKTYVYNPLLTIFYGYKFYRLTVKKHHAQYLLLSKDCINSFDGECKKNSIKIVSLGENITIEYKSE